jgi:hypothetical protein
VNDPLTGIGLVLCTLVIVAVTVWLAWPPVFRAATVIASLVLGSCVAATASPPQEKSRYSPGSADGRLCLRGWGVANRPILERRGAALVQRCGQSAGRHALAASPALALI